MLGVYVYFSLSCERVFAIYCWYCHFGPVALVKCLFSTRKFVSGAFFPMVGFVFYLVNGSAAFFLSWPRYPHGDKCCCVDGSV
jgi:hypothetical protein